LKILDAQFDPQNRECLLRLTLAGIGGTTYPLQVVTSSFEIASRRPDRPQNRNWLPDRDSFLWVGVHHPDGLFGRLAPRLPVVLGLAESEGTFEMNDLRGGVTYFTDDI
jgi:hypothetical protein